MKAKYFIMILFVWASALPLCAQTSCDKFFSTGVKLQQTMTVSSQKKAISYFNKAKVCYDSKNKKDLCDQQIKACKNIIAQLSKKTTRPSTVPKSGGETHAPSSTSPDVKEAKKNVQLSIDRAYLKFKGKGGEFKKAKIICNYADWVIVEKPDWVNCSRNEESEIVIEVEKNPSKNERSGVIVIECGNESVSLTIIQEKYKKYIIL